MKREIKGRPQGCPFCDKAGSVVTPTYTVEIGRLGACTHQIFFGWLGQPVLCRMCGREWIPVWREAVRLISGFPSLGCETKRRSVKGNQIYMELVPWPVPKRVLEQFDWQKFASQVWVFDPDGEIENPSPADLVRPEMRVSHCNSRETGGWWRAQWSLPMGAGTVTFGAGQAPEKEGPEKALALATLATLGKKFPEWLW